MSTIRMFFALLTLSAMSTAASAQDNEQAWQALRDGRAVLLLRHALAPGTGDPAHFALNDCTTQRNLNDRGRQQAAAWMTCSPLA